jgi:hypothetical protein
MADDMRRLLELTDQRTNKVGNDGKRGFGCVTPIITLARCVRFRRMAEGTVVILAQRSFFSEAFDPHRLFLCLYSRRDSIARLTRAQSPPDVGR